MASTDLGFSNFVDLLLESEGVNRSERQAEKQADLTIKCLERLAEGLVDLVEVPVTPAGAGISPMSRNRLSGPEWTNLVRGVVADSEHKTEGASPA